MFVFRCKNDDDYVYSGALCEESSSSKERQRKITLGVTIPIIVILFMLVIILCVKVNYKGYVRKTFISELQPVPYDATIAPTQS